MRTSGLREQKKQRTRDALVDAAYALFERDGFDATTVDRIVDAAHVSPRTFFRYFATKEDVALAQADEQLSKMVQALADRPPHESVITALRRSAVGVARAYEAGEHGCDQARHRRAQALLANTPVLRAACAERNIARVDEVAALIGLRMNVDPTTDPRPHLVAAVALCAVRPAVGTRPERGREAPTSQLIDEMFGLLATGLDYPAHGAVRREPDPAAG